MNSSKKIMNKQNNEKDNNVSSNVSAAKGNKRLSGAASVMSRRSSSVQSV